MPAAGMTGTGDAKHALSRAAAGRARENVLLLRDEFPEHPDLDAAVSEALLVAPNPESLRVFRPGRLVAFGRRDCLTPGYAAARAAAANLGFASVERSAGGHAAACHEGTLAFAWTFRDPGGRAHIRQHYHKAAMIVVEALRELGVDALIGPVPGEYCPGDFSVSAEGRAKLAGLAQRVTKDAVQVSGIVVVDGAGLARAVLNPVYAALGIDWDQRTVGSVADFARGATWERTAEAIIDAFSRQATLVEGPIPPAVLARAARLANRRTMGHSEP